MSAPLTRDAAMELLAERLYQKFEHIDPTGETWADLSDQERDMYRHALEAVFDGPIELLRAAVGSRTL